jgi:hypothetical protein
MKTRAEVWEEYERLREKLKRTIENYDADREELDDELVGKINALYWVLDQPFG